MKYLKKLGLREVFIGLLIAGLSITVVKYFSRQAGVWRTIRVEVTGNDWTIDSYGTSRPPFWLSEKIKKGDVELGVDGSKIAEIVRVENYERGDERADVYLTVKVKTELNQKLQRYIYKGRAIEVGSPIELRLSRALVAGQVIDEQIPEEGYKTKEVIIKGRWHSQEPWRINQVQIGDKMVDRGSNQAVAEILSVWTEAATQKATINLASDNQIKVSSSPRWVDGMITARLVLEEHDNRWYFGGHQKVKVGRYIWLYLPEVDLPYMEIEAVDEVVEK